MAKATSGESRHARIMRGDGLVFGSTLDALVRDVDARVPPDARTAHRLTLETWPIAPDGEVREAEALFARLSALRAAPEVLPTGTPPGSPIKAGVGLALGFAVGVPLGFLAHFIALEFLLPYAARSSDAVMWIIVAAVGGAAGLVGVKQGARPTRMGRALAQGLLAFAVGGVVSAFVAAFVALALGELFNVSQMEGAFAMGVVFTIMPVGAFVGGLACALWAGRRAWRRWGRA